jgi:hypothetical protein
LGKLFPVRVASLKCFGLEDVLSAVVRNSKLHTELSIEGEAERIWNKKVNKKVEKGGIQTAQTMLFLVFPPPFLPNPIPNAVYDRHMR